MPETRTTAHRPAILPGGLEPRCGDCEHFDEEGCAEAAEALVLEGWPRAAVVPEASAEAGRCPEFSPTEDLTPALDEEADAREAHARVAAIRNFSSW